MKGKGGEWGRGGRAFKTSLLRHRGSRKSATSARTCNTARVAYCGRPGCSGARASRRRSPCEAVPSIEQRGEGGAGVPLRV